MSREGLSRSSVILLHDCPGLVCGSAAAGVQGGSTKTTAPRSGARSPEQGHRRAVKRPGCRTACDTARRAMGDHASRTSRGSGTRARADEASAGTAACQSAIRSADARLHPAAAAALPFRRADSGADQKRDEPSSQGVRVSARHKNAVRPRDQSGLSATPAWPTTGRRAASPPSGRREPPAVEPRQAACARREEGRHVEPGVEQQTSSARRRPELLDTGVS